MTEPNHDYTDEQIEALKMLTDEQEIKLNKKLVEIEKGWFLVSNIVWFIIAILGFAISNSLHNIWNVVGTFFMIFSVGQMTYRAGAHNGYLRGFEDGHEEGVYKAVGISADEEQEDDG